MLTAGAMVQQRPFQLVHNEVEITTRDHLRSCSPIAMGIGIRAGSMVYAFLRSLGCEVAMCVGVAIAIATIYNQGHAHKRIRSCQQNRTAGPAG